MGQTATTIPPSGIGKLQFQDFLRGLVKSTSGLLIGLVIKFIQDKHLPPYSEIEPLLEATAYFFMGYIGINAATNNEGKMFKSDAPVVTVSAKELDKVIDKAADK